jgi:hypothetical protein
VDERSRKKPAFNALSKLYQSVSPVSEEPYPFGASR